MSKRITSEGGGNDSEGGGNDQTDGQLQLFPSEIETNTSKEKLEVRRISDLIGLDKPLRFFIPHYQRGYRWSERSVEDLLNDIKYFKVEKIGEESTWYCLQPIVVKERSDGSYEVIDGQQRLTTIWLILKVINEFNPRRQQPLFEISYETRTKSYEFMNQLAYETNEVNKENINFYCISRAFIKIKTWFTSLDKDGGAHFEEFQINFKDKTKIIWYECFEQDSISVFKRLNIGKIPLTNAELIKALFLKSSNFKENHKTPERLKSRQNEIALEWDLIERSLQNDQFWYFLTDDSKETNRIEIIFDLMSEATASSSRPDSSRLDHYATFRYFSNRFSEKDNVLDIWSEVKDYWNRFNEWFSERELYHKIGYLLTEKNITNKKLFLKSKDMSKTNFKKYLDSEIKNSVSKVSLDEIQYGDPTDNRLIKKVLLLYNILTMLEANKDDSRFPFNIFKKEKWDIEHITSIATPDSSQLEERDRQSWIDEVAKFIIVGKHPEGNDLQNRCSSINVTNEPAFRDLFNDLISYFNRELEDKDINDLYNLTLLDNSTNRSHKNSVFPLKRKKVIERDKSGVFVPICTKNVFLKYFSEYPPEISFWSSKDREEYARDLSRILTPYIKLKEE